jgi:ribosomal protein L40E
MDTNQEVIMAKISKPRKTIYYIGMIVTVIGVILFLSVFFSFANLFKSSMNFNSYDTAGPSFSNAILGMVMMIAGSIMMNIGARGAAGSGLILDPEKSREDLRPYNEAKGGMINDVIENIDALDHITKPHAEKEIVKIKCRNCNTLNEEDAKFCKGCGELL